MIAADLGDPVKEAVDPFNALPSICGPCRGELILKSNSGCPEALFHLPRAITLPLYPIVKEPDLVQYRSGTPQIVLKFSNILEKTDYGAERAAQQLRI